MSDEKEKNPILENLMERRTVFLEGDITHDSISDVCSRLMLLQTHSSDRITLMINSGGGDLYAALQLCDQMKVFMTAPVRGIAFGDCGSSATFVMLHCKERYSTPYSRFLIHSGNLGGVDIPVGRTSSRIAEQLLASVKSTEDQVINIYADHLTPKDWKNKKISSEKKREFVQRLIDRGDQRFNSWMSATEAVEIGLIDDVCSSKLDIF